MPVSLVGGVRHSASLETSAGRALLKVPSVGRFVIQADGVLTAPEPGAGPASLAYFQDGLAQVLRLQLQGVVVLRASAVALPGGRTAVFCGASTSGKSSLAALLASLGAQVLADEWVPLTMDGPGRVWATPFQPQCQLDRHSLQQLGWTHRTEGAQPVRPGLDKYAMALPPCVSPSPVTELFELTLDESQGLSDHRISGLKRMETLLNAVHSPPCLQASGRYPQGLHLLAQLASSSLAMRRLVRPQVGVSIQEVADLVWAPAERP